MLLYARNFLQDLDESPRCRHCPAGERRSVYDSERRTKNTGVHLDMMLPAQQFICDCRRRYQDRRSTPIVSHLGLSVWSHRQRHCHCRCHHHCGHCRHRCQKVGGASSKSPSGSPGYAETRIQVRLQSGCPESLTLHRLKKTPVFVAAAVKPVVV